MWTTFVSWFTQVIQFMFGLTQSLGIPNYGLAIIFMSIAIKIVIYPLTHKQMKSMREMQVLQPRMKELQERYKDDPQTMQKKLGELYKEHGVNPFSGCLPLLIQMPILFAFYRALFNLSETLLQSPYAKFLWIENIGNPDQYYILPVLVAATTYLQQKISMADNNDPTQKSMLYMMPVFIGFVSWKMAAGLSLYWVTFNLLSIAQQLYVNFTMDKTKAVDAGTGMVIGKQVLDLGDSDEAESEAPKEKEARRDKGGKSQDGAANSRKKRKKH